MTSDEFYNMHIGYVSQYTEDSEDPEVAKVGDIRLQFWPSAITLQIILSRSPTYSNGRTLTANGRIARRHIKYCHRSIRYAKPAGPVRIA